MPAIFRLLSPPPCVAQRLFLGATVLFYLNTANAADILPAPTQVSPHVYAWIGPHGAPNTSNRGFRMNMAFVVGKDAVAVIETGYSEAMAKEMIKKIKAITNKPIKFAINSNSQPDRFLGNEVFRRHGAAIITSSAEAARMAEMGGMFAAGVESALKLPAGSVTIPAAPTRVITANDTVELGEVTLKLYQFGAAHTPSPLVVEVVQDKVVYGGDILYSGRLLATIEAGNVQSWIKVFDELRRFGDASFVPGHGKPAKLTAFEFPTRDYLVLLHSHMKKMLAENIDMIDAIDRLDQSKFAGLENYDELARRNAHTVYREAELESFK